jgi:hypothetical protein
VQALLEEAAAIGSVLSLGVVAIAFVHTIVSTPSRVVAGNEGVVRRATWAKTNYAREPC